MEALENVPKQNGEEESCPKNPNPAKTRGHITIVALIYKNIIMRCRITKMPYRVK